MPTSHIVPVQCSAVAEPVLDMPVPGRPVSKLSGAWACQEARRRVLDHVAKRQSREPTPSGVLQKTPPTCLP